MLQFFKNNKLIIVATVVAVVFMFVIIGLYSVDNSQNDNVISYINSLGWQVDKKPVEISYLTIPAEFDIIFNTYNALQNESGFDLSQYKGEKVTRYSYKVTNHVQSDSEFVRINIFLFQGKIIAGDVCSNSLNGFMHPITDTVNKQQ